MKYSHIIFDIDGTLTDTDYAVLTSLQNVIRERLHKEYAIPELYFVKGIPGWAAFEQLGFAKEDFADVMREWEDGMRALNDTIHVYEGVSELMETLAQAGVRMGVATSKTRDQYEKDFCRFDIASYIGVSVTCDETDDPKPGAGPLREYMKKTGARPEEMLYIGDSIYDAMTAKNAGVDFALAVWGTTDLSIGAEYRPQRPLDLLGYIEK